MTSPIRPDAASITGAPSNMNCLGCGSAWFSEERQIISVAEPATPFHRAQMSRERFSYSCAECGLAYGEKPKAKRKKRG